MNRANNSLRRRLLLRLWVPLASLLVAGAVIAYVVAFHFASVVHDRWLLDSALTLATQLGTDKSKLSLDLPSSAIEMFEWDLVDRIYWDVVSPEGRILFGNSNLPFTKSLKPGEPSYYNAEVEGNAVRIVAIFVHSPSDPSQSLTIQVGETKRKRNALAREIILVVVPLQAGILLIAGGLIWFAVTSSLRSLDEITTRLRGYEPQHLAPLLDVERAPSEVQPLMVAVNSLIGKISESQAAQQRFVANAAHQLRTPLAALQVQTERASREKDPEHQWEALTKMRDAVARMRHVTQQLLTLTRSHASSSGMLALSDVDLSELAQHELLDHPVTPTGSGIRARKYTTALEYGAIATEAGGALWLGGESELGLTFWQTIDSSVWSGLTAQGMKWGFGRKRPSQTDNPDEWFKGTKYQSFPSGEVTLQASFVTPFIVTYGDREPWIWALAG